MKTVEEIIYTHEFVKDAVIAIETGLLFIFMPLTEGENLIAAALLLMAVMMFILRDVDIAYFRKLKKEQRMTEMMKEEEEIGA